MSVRHTSPDRYAGGLGIKAARMAPVTIVEPVHERRPGLDDEAIGVWCAAPTLITGSAVVDVVHLAHRIHAAGPGAGSPFVQVSAGTLPTDPTVLAVTWTSLLQAATRGTVLLMHVEDMPAVVQDRFTATLIQQHRTRGWRSAVRLMAGTTVSLGERTADGTFSERLFRRLQVNHVVVRGAVLLRQAADRRQSQLEPF